jgi:hypothetical protein
LEKKRLVGQKLSRAIRRRHKANIQLQVIRICIKSELVVLTGDFRGNAHDPLPLRTWCDIKTSDGKTHAELGMTGEIVIE